MRKLLAFLAASVLLIPLLGSAASDPASNTDAAQTTAANTTGAAQDATPPAPSADAPYQFKRQGIFDCNQIGGLAQSVGTLAAQGGVYVPVNDAAVTLNTGILVYKECVLREVVDREREAAMAAFFKKIYTGIQTGRNGNPQYVVNENQEIVTGPSDQEFSTFLQGPELQTLNPALQGPIQHALARYYMGETRGPQALSLKCPYQGDLKSFQQTGQLPAANFFNDFFNATAPQCDVVMAEFFAQDIADARVAQAISNQRDQWTWSGGFYPVTDNATNPLNQRILTPASVVAQSFQQILGSPVRQLESANDIGQMIGALYAGVTTQIVSDNKGLAGLSQSVAGQPSYLDQVASESAQGVRDAAVNAALQNLAAWRQIEAAYFQAVNAIGATLTQTIGQLKSAENQCWDLVIYKNDGHPEQHVCTGPLSGNRTCTDASGNSIKVATSTAFSQPIINTQIAPLASSTIPNIQKSQQALSLIDNMIQGVTNTASLDAQRVSLQQLDSLVAQHAFHTQNDLQAASQQAQDVQAAMSTLVTNTVQAWADSTDPSVGWCNVQNPAVIQGWDQRWRQ